MKNLKIQFFVLLPLAILFVSQACSQMESASLSSKSVEDGLGTGQLIPAPGIDENGSPLPPGSEIDNSKFGYFTSYSTPTETELLKLQNDFIPLVHPTGKDNRYSTAIFGLAREMMKYGSISLPPTYQIQTSFMNKSLPVQLHIAKLGPNPRRAPLAVILNPLYSGESTGQMNRFIQYFKGRGFHVMVFMNPWSPDVVEKNPKFMIGDIWKEASMHIEVMDQIIASKIGKNNVSGGTLVGLSYGAFLGSIVKAYDQKRSAPVIDGPVLLLSPPHDIIKSAKNIDRQITESSSLVVQCTLFSDQLSLLGTAINLDDYNKTNINETCSKFLLSFVGFQATLKLTVGALNLSKNLGLNFFQLADMTYESYLKDVSKLNPSVQEQSLGYWMNQAKFYGFDKFVVVASSDDNINEGVPLKPNPYFNFNNSNSILLSTGGHTGFRAGKSKSKTCGQDWTDCLLKAVYN